MIDCLNVARYFIVRADEDGIEAEMTNMKVQKLLYLELRISKGASGQIRLMYLVNTTACVIRLVWIYSHEQFAKHPADKDLKSVIKEILDC